jgi:hypothetical protein
MALYFAEFHDVCTGIFVRGDTQRGGVHLADNAIWLNKGLCKYGDGPSGRIVAGDLFYSCMIINCSRNTNVTGMALEAGQPSP